MIKARIGELDERITFQTETTAADGMGGVTSTSWANIADTPEVWAKVVTDASDEGERGSLITNEYPVTVIIRNRSDIDPTMRVVWRALNYAIRSITPYSKREEFRLLKLLHGAPGQGT